MRVSISGQKFDWRYSRLRGKANGWCYHLEKKILIDSRLSGVKRLEVELHEFLHASNPNHSEEAVTMQAADLAEILWKIGYRIDS